MAAGSTRQFHYGLLTDLQAARLLIIHALVVIACMFLMACAGSLDWRGTSQADAAARIAEKMVGTPYVPGGTNPDEGFDCSGLVQYSYKEAGLFVPRTTKDQFRQSRSVSNPRKGDLLFFDSNGRSASHVGIYIGNDKFVHVSFKKKRVLIASLSAPHWQKEKNSAGIRRLGATVVALKY